MNKILEANHITKFYGKGKNKLEVINDASLVIAAKEKIALVGPSGSGKTTLLQILALLDTANSGSLEINGKNVSRLTDKARTEIRKTEIGFVFQMHHLMPEFDVLENVMFPLLINGVSRKKASIEAMHILDKLGLKNRHNHKPSELSGGEQQRTAIARAIIHKPKLLLADEPTGNLDPKNADKVFEIFLNLAKEYNIACLMVTHNQELAKKMDRVLTIKNNILKNLK